MTWAMTRKEKHEEKRLKEQYKRQCRESFANKLAKLDKKKRGRQRRKWRLLVLNRDDYTCQHCESTEDLHVHHIKPKAEYPELKFVVENGLSLCEDCHDVVHDGLVSYYKQQTFLRGIVS